MERDRTMARARRTPIITFAMAVAGLVSCMATALKAETYTLGADETFTLDSSGAANASENRLDITGSATLKLTGSATNGAFPLKMGIRFTSAAADAVLTVDVSEVADCNTIRMTGNMRDNSGSAVVALPSTIVEFVAGSTSRGADTNLSFPAFEPNVSFAGEGSVVFTNDVSVVKLPTCSWCVADGSRVATLGPGALGSGNFTLTSYDVELCNPASFDLGSTVTVPVDRTLYVRPCVFNNNENGTWVGTSSIGGTGAGYITNDVVLGGSGAKVFFQNNNNIYGINGTISGEGNVSVCGNGDVYMSGAFDWSGTFTVAKLGISHEAKYVFYTTNCATITPAIVANHTYGGDFRFYPTGYPNSATELRLTSFTGNATAKYASIRVAEKETITVGEISGTVRALYGGDGAKLVVESLAANATLYLQPNLDLTVKAAGAGAKVVFESVGEEGEKWLFSGPDTGVALSPSFEYPDNAAETAITLGGRLTFPSSMPLAFGTVTILAGADVSASIADGTKIVNSGGMLTQLVKTWQDKVTLWVDASDVSTFTSAKADYPDYAASIDANRISEWCDRRTDHRGEGAYSLRLPGFDNRPTDITGTTQGGFPITNTTANLRAVKFSRNRGRFQIVTGRGAVSTVTVKYALFVFNSSDCGGGNAFFCNANGLLSRVESPTSNATSGQKPLVFADANNSFSFRTNGVDVVSPTETYTTGGWQIISFANQSGVEISNIGHAKTANTATGNGGQIYAEILLFSELPTEEEREAAETYLAKKWNLPLGHEDVVQRQDVNIELSGSGTVSLASNAAVTNGMFSGTVNLNGHRLQVSTNALPYTEATIPSDGRVLWIDPSYAGAVVYGDDENKPLEVAYIYARDNTGLLTDPSAKCVASPYSQDVDMRVRTVSGARASGTASTWLDFSNGYGNDNYRNHLQVKKDLSSDIPSSYSETATFVSVKVKAGFFALDTTRGGGTAIASTVNGTGGSFKWRNSQLNTAPIWQSGSVDAVKNSDAYLDGVQIDATSTSYSLRPEVFSFNLQPEVDAQDAKVFGFSGTGSSSVVNPEIMGEWILYSARQSDADRARIEAYLMKKWLGKLHEGFSDFRDMAVSGDGVLAAEGPEYLPTLTAAFTGSLEFSRTAWSFTLPRKGGSAAVDAVDLSGQTVALPAEVAINLDVTGVTSGTYLLMRVGSFSGDTTFTLGAIVGQRGRSVAIFESNGELYANVVALGTVLIVE